MNPINGYYKHVVPYIDHFLNDVFKRCETLAGAREFLFYLRSRKVDHSTKKATFTLPYN